MCAFARLVLPRRSLRHRTQQWICTSGSDAFSFNESIGWATRSPGRTTPTPAPARQGREHERQCSAFVLDFCPRLGYILSHPALPRGALARRRKLRGRERSCGWALRKLIRQEAPAVAPGSPLVQGRPHLRLPPWAEAEPAPPVRLKEPCARRRSVPPLQQPSSRSAPRAPLDLSCSPGFAPQGPQPDHPCSLTSLARVIPGDPQDREGDP